MRALILGLLIAVAASTSARGDIIATCYTSCESETESNPAFKACLSRAANKADRLLNQSYAALQDAVRKQAETMGQSPGGALSALTAAQNGSITGTAIAPLRTLSPSAARLRAAIIPVASAR